MKTPRSRSNDAWEKLVQQARSDVAPAVDVAAVRRVVRGAALESPSAGWMVELSRLFAARGVMRACLGGAGACAVLTTWQVWEMWQVLPWAEMLSTGGAP